jgi:glyoxylase-like metal-dependent hydrolase (beta-lactamase superfamily II)
MEVTGTSQRQAWIDKVMPPVERLRPRLWSFPLPLPDTPLRYVVVYGWELPDGIALVDAGWDTAESWTALTDGLALAGYQMTDVRAVLVTHVHPDHYGMAGRIREESGAWLALHPAEAQMLPDRYTNVDGLVAKTSAWLERCGVPDDVIRSLAEASIELLPYIRLAQPDRLLEDGDRVPLPGWDLRALWTPGHTAGHLCFYEPQARLLLSGDHVLPRITPNISAHPQQIENPLGHFADSLLRVRDLDLAEVLPAHEYRFSGLDDRVDQLLAHHSDRLGEIWALLDADPGLTVWQMSGRLVWSRPWEAISTFMRRAAVGETLAHLLLLEAGEIVVRDAGPPERWQAVAPLLPDQLRRGAMPRGPGSSRTI